MQVSGKALRKQRVQLIGLAALFIAPVLISWLVWKTLQGGGQFSTTNSGELVSPARPLAAFSASRADSGRAVSLEDLRGKWTYLVFAGESCQEDCRQDLYHTRQLRTSVNKDIDRVQRVLVLHAQPDSDLLKFMKEEHPDASVFVDSADRELSTQFRFSHYQPDGRYIFLLDPLVNLMMVYSRDAEWKGMFKDLTRLLKISQIG